MNNNLVYGINDKPKFGQLVIFAFQQLLAIMAATLAVPVVISSSMGLAGADAMSSAAALCGAGIGTIVYLLFTKSKSPVFLGSSFAFIGSMCSAFAGAATVALGYLGLIIGAVIAGLVYVVIAIIIKAVGTKWVNKLMPAVVIGPTVAIIGLSLAGNAVGDLSNANGGSVYVALVCGLVTLFVTMLCSTFGKKTARLIPFIIGILAGYAAATVFYLIGKASGNDALIVISYQSFADCFSNFGFHSIISVPEFTFVKALGAFGELNGSYLVTLFSAYAPVAFVVFAEHIADHENLSTIIGQNLLEEPGLQNTLLGDGVGSMVGAVFGGCPNTTYGESIGCVAITKNASVATIWCTAFLCIIVSFISPFVAFLNSIPSCVMGGVCIALYGFIAVSGLKMLQPVDLNENHNLFTASVILITGVGGMTVSFGSVEIRTVAVALILGIITNAVLTKKKA